MTAVKKLEFEPMVITLADAAKAGRVQKNQHHKNEGAQDPSRSGKGLGDPHPKAPKLEGRNSMPSIFKNIESFRQTLGSLKPVMSLTQFESLTTKRDPAPMTMNLILPGKNGKPVYINDVRYADDKTLMEFVGMSPPQGFHQTTVNLNGKPEVVFFSSAQLLKAKGVLPGVVTP